MVSLMGADGHHNEVVKVANFGKFWLVIGTI